MVITDFGASGLALRLGSGTAIPAYIAIGIGSKAISVTRSGLAYEVSRRAFSSTDITTQKQYEMIADWSTIDMSGIQLTEFAVFDSGSAFTSAITGIVANAGFETTITSGTDWYFSGTTGFFSGLKVSDFVTEGGSNFKIFYHSGTSALTSGANAYLKQQVNLSGVYRIDVDLKITQPYDRFETKFLFGGSLLGSIYGIGSQAGITGTQMLDVVGYTNTDDFQIMMSAFSGGNMKSGLYHLDVDNIVTQEYSGGKCWSVDGFRKVTFDGSNELQVQITYEVFNS